jgi:hypothetical protein
MNYKNLTKIKNTSAGVAENGYIAVMDWFNTIAKAPAKSDTQVKTFDHLTIAGTHTFKPQPGQSSVNYGFIKCRFTPDKNKLDLNSIGDAGLLRINSEFEFVIPGLTEESVGLVTGYLMNQPCMLISKDINKEQTEAGGDQLVYQLGDEDAACWIKEIKQSTGTTKDGSKSLMVKMQYAGLAYFYGGAITLMP